MNTFMKKLHHGLPKQRGAAAMRKMSSENNQLEGRFGRLFPYLPPLYTNPVELAKLGVPDGPMDGGQGKESTETVPLGFIFLGQFIDHDITLDVTSSLDRTNDPQATVNFRTPTFDLDCIYGSGPEASPYLYADDGVRLLTGADIEPDENEPQHHDLLRNGLGRALIGDFRNDENRLISQLQLAFINFHNQVVAHVAAEEGLSGPELFEAAQRLVRWHYQWVIVHEFLPLIVGNELLQDILGNGRLFYKPNGRSYIPIEFSAAAYRFGHSMITQTLKVQPTQTHPFDLFGPSLGKGFTPLNDLKQVVDWSLFFQIDGSAPQLADKLNTKLASDLLELPFIKNDENSLATRNLLRGQSFLLPSGEQVAQAMNVDGNIIDAVTKEVKMVAESHAIHLDAGTPLWYYILMEAELIGRDGDAGEGLGPVGGRIVGELFIGLLECDPNSYLAKERNWLPTLGANESFTMADLLTFAA